MKLKAANSVLCFAGLASASLLTPSFASPQTACLSYQQTTGKQGQVVMQLNNRCDKPIQVSLQTNQPRSVSLHFAKADFQPAVIGYWQNFNNPAQTPVKLTDIPAGYTVVSIAFADIAADGTVSFHLQGPPYDTMANGDAAFRADIKALQARGIKVLLSLGGQNGTYPVNNVDQQNRFTQTLEGVIKDYGFDGVDYDFESGLTTSNAQYLANTTTILKNDFPRFYVTIAPETVDVYWQNYAAGKYNALLASGLVNAVQVQLYNSGCMNSSQPGSPCYSESTEDFAVSQADSTIQTWQQHQIANASSLYVLGFPATQGAAGGGYMDPAIVVKAMHCLQSGKECDSYVPQHTYPNLGGVMSWDINWDAKNHYQFVNAVSKG